MSEVLSFQQTRAAADIARDESRTAAAQEDLAVTQREADRKSRLAEALASQNAQAGAKGVAAFEGSPLAILQEDIRREGVATERDVFEGRIKKRAILARGKLTQRALKTQANIQALKSAQKAAAGAG